MDTFITRIKCSADVHSDLQFIRYVWPLPQSTTTLEHHQKIMSEMFNENLKELPAEMIYTRMDELQAKLAELSSQISQKWFHPDRSVA